MPEALPPVDADIAAEIVALAEKLAARDDHADASAQLEWLIDALIMRGQLPASFRRLATKIRGQGPRALVRLATFRDKYAIEGPDIDCAARLPLCGARCCSLAVSLSAQDIAEGGIPFDVADPYRLPRTPDGRCVCMDDAGACTIYDKRPGTCRAYDCRHDPRVWIDFEARIPAPT